MPPRKAAPARAARRLQGLLQRAATYREQGRYEQAERLYSQALPLAEHAFGRHDTVVAAVCNDWGVLYKYMGRFAAAGRLYRRALAILEKVFGPDDPALA